MIEKERKHGLEGRAYLATRSLLRLFLSERVERVPKNSTPKKIRLAFIHNEKRVHVGVHTGAAQINRIMASALAKRGVQVRNFYPRTQLTDAPVHLKGLANILFFYSLLEHKDKMLTYDIIQGTTYTPLPFLAFNVPVVCHFGSTARGYLASTPRTSQLRTEEREVFKELTRLGIVPEFDLKTLRPIEDIADIEAITATRATACIATSLKVRDELIGEGVPADRVHVIHNAIEDYWFEPPRAVTPEPPHLVFLGRLGNDVFTLKLKGLSRLVNLYRAFPDVPKTTICMTTNRKLKDWLRVSFPKHYMYVNLRKDLIPGALAPLYGSILFISSRYEGFSLSLVEGMSQGLVPMAFPVGIAPEIIRDGENGFLVSSVEQAIERARELLGNEEKRLIMATTARQTAEQFRSARIADDLQNLYRKIKDERRRTNGNGNSHAENVLAASIELLKREGVENRTSVGVPELGS
ncbi:MAG: glycosyltransferase family 4 protein [Patescibacteria group bacterium]|nr:glycosyltransferase family 4 protein [Patescibacteria group bacterium]